MDMGGECIGSGYARKSAEKDGGIHRLGPMMMIRKITAEVLPGVHPCISKAKIPCENEKKQVAKIWCQFER